MLILGRILLGLGVGFTNQVSRVVSHLIEQARKALSKVRGSEVDVEPELKELIRFAEVAKSIKEEPFKNIFERKHRHHLVMALAIPFFQQLTGINIVAFYAPNLFQSVGLGNDVALLSAVILGLVNLGVVLISSGIVDHFGAVLTE